MDCDAYVFMAVSYCVMDYGECVCGCIMDGGCDSMIDSDACVC